ncbi:multiple epidermal growth factor-like domains protein 10 [Ruditapes philippinarum]|uniref:multiple epidermal growth factor-like domains protein 10 n=1 Tax=Ruditapes philippinarum TaxID=129788 RepID=UPI00295AF81C|nr:multiple epidermal growth factor-like domains protein 10 [Ruditapes philippinarum]XP_060587087.1 multiple epidermal growth factor-like domains protein 10 [Ruditapes philippinarum]
MIGITMITLLLEGQSLANICTRGETNYTTSQYRANHKIMSSRVPYRTCYFSGFICSTKYKIVTRLITVRANYMVVRCCPGTVNDECKPGCEEDMTGSNCTHNCNWCPAHCDMGTGSCFCEPGYFGYNCTKECSRGFYGVNCEQKCGCSNNSTCNAVDGSCNCTSGWHGTFCDNDCLHGTYGPNCKWPCNCNNSIHDSCNRYTGQCACKSGWTGRTCDKANLDNGERGDTMSTTAKPDYGETGYTMRTTADNDYREQGNTRSTTGKNENCVGDVAIIGSVIGALAIGLIIGAICVWFILSRKGMAKDSRKQNQPQPKVTQETEFTEPPLTSNNYEQLQNRTDTENRDTYESLDANASSVPKSQPQYESLEHGADTSHTYTDLKHSR